MPTIYISDSGDDKNDGLSLRTAIYSLERGLKNREVAVTALRPKLEAAAKSCLKN
jgi:hypothetical protein